MTIQDDSHKSIDEILMDMGYTFINPAVITRPDGSMAVQAQLYDPQGKPVVMEYTRPNTCGLLTGIE